MVIDSEASGDHTLVLAELAPFLRQR
jgi:hypothetical protein